MKVILFLLLAISIHAQTFEKAYTFNNVITWCDSLWSAKGDSTYYGLPSGFTINDLDSALSDTSKIYEIRGSFKWISLEVEDSGGLVDDSIGWYLGFIIRDQGRDAVDTTWKKVRYEDSAGTAKITNITNAGWTATYVTDFEDLHIEAAELMKIESVNAEWIPLRRTKLYWKALRK